uniref:Uncharacterized protein n=1 Tax=Anguilla anguilla TaxID=7936 RepID=A0A0E9VNV4_ANGAN
MYLIKNILNYSLMPSSYLLFLHLILLDVACT